MKRRMGLIATLLAAVLVVSAPTAAFAFWVTSAQTTLSARSATFAVSAPGSTAGTINVLTSSSSNSSGFSGTTTSSAVYTNTGATPWATVAVQVTAAASFGSGALATSSVAVVGSAAACPASTAYTPLVGGAATLPAAIAPGAALKVCVLTAYDRLSLQSRTASSALQIVVTPTLQNWTVGATAVTVTTTAPNAGLMACTAGSGGPTLSAVAPQDGTYHWVDNTAGAEQTYTAGQVVQFGPYGLSLFGRTGTLPITLERKNADGSWTAVAQGAFTSAGFFIVSYTCA